MDKGFWRGVLFAIGFILLTACYVVAIDKFGIGALLRVMGGNIGAIMYSNAIRK